MTVKSKLNIVFSTLFSLFLVGCQTVHTLSVVEDRESDSAASAASDKTPMRVPPALQETKVESQELPAPWTPPTVVPTDAVAAPPAGDKPQPGSISTGSGPKKLGLILGPGGLRAYGEIGFLEELTKAKIPIHGVVGLEMGALVGAAYAAKGQTFDAEWQLMKIKEDDWFNRNFMGTASPQDFGNLHSFWTGIWGAQQIEATKVPFACPTLPLQERRGRIVEKGSLVEAVEACVPAAPFFKAYKDRLAATSSLALAAQYLRSKGADYLVYVDVLSDRSGPFFPQAQGDENGMWATVAESLEMQSKEVQKVVVLNLGNFTLNDFVHRRDMIQKGQEAGRLAVPELQREMGN